MKEVEKAESDFNRALETLGNRKGKERRKILYNFAFLLENKSNFQLAAQYWKELLNELQEEKSEELIPVMNNLASALLKTGNLSEPEEILENSLKNLEKSSNIQEKIKALNLLSVVHSQKDPLKSEALLIKALSMAEPFYGGNHLKLAEIYNNLGSLSFKKGDISKGETYFSKALLIQEKVLDFTNAEELAKTYFMMGLMSFVKGELTLSEKHFLKSLNLKTQKNESFKRNDPMIPKILGNLALIAFSSNDHEKALKLYLQCKELQENSIPGSLDLALTYFHLGLTCFNLEDFEESEKFYLKSLEIQEKVRKSEDLELISLWNNLANTSFMLKKYEISEKFHLKCLELLVKVHGNDHPDTLATKNTLEALKPYLQVKVN
jgi:tetratricopeptide (TPR) repeat protein